MLKYIFLVLAIVQIISGDNASPQLLVKTPSLGLIQGEINPIHKNVGQYLGIPFAKPPVGNLRFKPPVPLTNGLSSAVYNATTAARPSGNAALQCLQLAVLGPKLIHGQEDCLYLDIYVPSHASNESSLPVVIYIYGGGFESSDPIEPTTLVALYENIIYVTIRYRVDVFGFMASTALSANRSGPIQSSGLQGFEDQQLAMRWVQENIRAFGGNPNLVTLQGQSAGAISICLHLVAPGSANLFHRAIIESGGCDLIYRNLTDMEKIGDDITSNFCSSSSDVIACLQAIDGSALLEYAQSKDYLNFFTTNALHLPVDGLIFPDSVTKLFRGGHFSKNISILTGTTKDEFALFISLEFEPGWKIENLNQDVLNQWVQLYSGGQSAYLNHTYNPYIDPDVLPSLVNYYGLTDAMSTGVFQCPGRRTAAYLSDHGNDAVYLYSFDYVPITSTFLALSQSVHGQELPFVFDLSIAKQPGTSSLSALNPDEQLLAWAMSLLWIRFAVNGDPNIRLNKELPNPIITELSELGGWPKYSTGNPSSYIIFTNAEKRHSRATIRAPTGGYHSPTCAAWDEVVPNPNITKRCNPGYTGPNCTKTNDNTMKNRFHAYEQSKFFQK